MRYTTWHELQEVLPPEISAETVALIKRFTGPVRHEWRTEKATQAAEAWVRAQYGAIWDSTHIVPAAQALCWLESRGLYGGGCYQPGAGTRRHPAFAGLGKGRRHARDGRAWTAAIFAAGTRGPIRWDSDGDGNLTVTVQCQQTLDTTKTYTFLAKGLLLDEESRKTAAGHALRDAVTGAWVAPENTINVIAAAVRLLDKRD